MKKRTTTWCDGLALPPTKKMRPLAGRRLNWEALRRQAVEFDSPLTTEEFDLWKRGIIDPVDRMWAVDYLHAIETAVKKRDDVTLLAMLRADIPFPAFLAPALADAFAARATGKGQPGRATALTAVESSNIKSMFDQLFSVHKLRSPEAKARRRVIGWLADVKCVSVKTIERALRDD